MQTLLFIHLSLAVPNQRGLNQSFLGEKGENNLLFYMLSNLASSREIQKIVLLTSGAPEDLPVRQHAEKIKNSIPVSFDCHVVEEGKEWSFEKNRILRKKEAPHSIRMLCGAYHLGYFKFLKEVYGFERAILLMAESFPFLSGEYLDLMIRESEGQLCLFSSHFGAGPLIIAPYKEVSDKSNELKSEKTQEYLYLKNRLSKKSVSPLTVEFFQKELDRSFYFEDILWKSRRGLLPPKQGLNPFFPVLTQEDYRLASGILNLAEIRKDFPGDSFSQWEKQLSREIESLKENLLKRDNVPFNNVIHLVMDFFEGVPELGNVEAILNSLAFIIFPPRLVTLKIKTEDLDSEQLSRILNKTLEMQMLSRMICLRRLPTDFVILTKKIQEGLNGLVLRISLTDWNEKLNQDLKILLHYRRDNPGWNNFLLYLEIENVDFQEDIRIKEIFEAYVFIVDGIILLPPSRKKGINLDLSNMTDCGKQCEWSRNTLILNNRNELMLCEENSSVSLYFSPDHWKEIMNFQGCKSFCEECTFKTRINGMQEVNFPLPPFMKNSRGVPDLTGAIRAALFSRLQLFYKTGQKEFFPEMLKRFKQFDLDMKEILFHPDFFTMLQEMIRDRAYAEALDIISFQLSYDPMSRTVLDTLESLEKSLEIHEE